MVTRGWGGAGFSAARKTLSKQVCFSYPREKRARPHIVNATSSGVGPGSNPVHRSIPRRRHSSEGTGQMTADVTRARVRQVLDDGVRTVFQPIVALPDGELRGLEALSRFPDGDPPDRWFDAGWTVGLGSELELLSLRSALAHLRQVPAGAWLSVNLAPEVVFSPALEHMLSGVAAERLVIEITEHSRVEDYIALGGALARLRALGCRVAVDDAGAGFASLNHVLSLNPDIIKLDGALTRGVDTDPGRQALAVSLVSFAAAIGAELVAEGVETAAQAEALFTLGCGTAQGFYFAHPGVASLADRLPPPSLPPLLAP
jgi:EAL domain-containing protein (putative c-di-GMP-specific phosphodiesterase class I)